MGFIRRITGKTAADAAKEAAAVQVDYSQQASELLNPFAGIGQSGIDQAGFLTDPDAQYDFVKNNPLFTAALDNANNRTLNMAAAKGRLSAGDTQTGLANNVLLAASPLISDQKNSINNLLNLGSNTAANQGNLLTGQGATLASGIVGAENARGAGYQNVIDLGAKVGSALFGGG